MAKIIIIDDNVPILEMLYIGLTGNGHSVQTFTNGETALSQINELEADFIFIDIFLPTINGYDLIKNFKSKYPNVQIIAISGGFEPFQSNSCINIAKKMGADNGLEKPFRLHQVLDIINSSSS